MLSRGHSDNFLIELNICAKSLIFSIASPDFIPTTFGILKSGSVVIASVESASVVFSVVSETVKDDAINESLVLGEGLLNNINMTGIQKNQYLKIHWYILQ